LETPAQSLAFLEYFQKHVTKVDVLQKRLSKFASFFLVLGLGALTYAVFSYMAIEAATKKQTHQRLRSSAAEDIFMDESVSTACSAISCFIWGLVVTKAKSGLAASNTKDSSVVGGLLKKTGSLIMMISIAAAFQMASEMQNSNANAKQSAAISHKLKAVAAPLVEDHPASFYDKSSSHYMGGAHNVALANMGKITDSPKQFVGESQKELGGAHNAAYELLAKKSKKVRTTKSQSLMNSLGDSYKATLNLRGNRKVSSAQYQKNLYETGVFVTFIATLALCIAYYVTFKTYHANLEKLDSLTALFNNPNARVAAGNDGKRIMKKLGITKEKEVEAPKKVEDTVEQITALLQARLAQSVPAQPQVAAYQAPALTQQCNNTNNQYSLDVPQYQEPFLKLSQAPQFQV